MLLRQLEYFVAVARERHFARAAEACYVSQPALSTAIAKLERELDVTLIYRGQNFEGLTLEGERLVVWAKRLLAEHDGLKAEAAAMRAGISGTLRLGTGPTVSTTTAAARRRVLRAAPPGQGDDLLPAVVHRAAAPTAQLRTRRRHRPLRARRPGPASRWCRCIEERYVLLVSGDQLAPGARTITWAEAAQLPLALLMPHMRFRQFIDKAFAAQRGAGHTAGRNRFGRFALRTRRHRRVGERGAAHLAARHPG